MGLFIISGTMGGGKSYYAAELAYECWKAGGYVHSNLPWEFDELERLGFAGRHIEVPKDTTKWVTKVQTDDGEVLQSDWIRGGAEGQENLIIIDEAALCFHAYDQAENRKRNRSIFELVVMSRQIGVDMYFISQAATNIDSAIRKVAEVVIRCINVSRINGIGPILAPLLGTFRRVWTQPEKGGEISAQFARFNPAIGALYKTHGVGDRVQVQRDASRKAKPAKLSLAVWAFLLLVAGLLGFSLWMAYKTPKALSTVGHFAEKTRLEQLEKQVAEGTAAPAPAQAKANIPFSKREGYLVARIESPLTIYDSLGRVHSIEARNGQRAFVGMSEDADTVTINYAGAEPVILNKHQPLK